MKKSIITLTCIVLVSTLNTGCVISQGQGSNMLGSFVESLASKTLYGQDPKDAFLGAASRAVRYNVDDVTEAAFNHVNEYGLDEFDKLKLIDVAKNVERGETVEWFNPYTRKTYRAVPRAFSHQGKGQVCREVVVHPEGYNARSITVEVSFHSKGSEVKVV